MRKHARVSLLGACTLFIACLALHAQLIFILGDGHYWLRLTTDQQLFYLQGYLDGYRHGHREGCYAADRHPSTKEARALAHECLQAMLKFSKGTKYYADQIAKYYQRYPEDRKLRVQRVLFRLSDQNNRSLEDIHTLYQAGKLP